MTSIEETRAVGQTLPPQQKRETKTVEGAEKVGREMLVSTPTKGASVEQAHISSTSFEGYLLNEVGTLTSFPLQFVEAARLGSHLEKGLVEFEKGKPFSFIAKSGTQMTLQPGEKASFVRNFTSLLSSLSQQSEGSPQLKTFFYGLLKKFVESSAFRSTNPKWDQIVQKEKETLAKLPAEETAREVLEQAFQTNPSLESLARLFSEIN